MNRILCLAAVTAGTLLASSPAAQATPVSALPLEASASKFATDTAATVTIPLSDGSGTITVKFTAAAADQRQVAEPYVAFLESLPHGPELAKLQLLIGAPDEIARLCGDDPEDAEAAIGCYTAQRNEIAVPAGDLAALAPGSDEPVGAVLAHEYAHHISNHRENPGLPGGAADWGPKFWSSYVMACKKAGEGIVFPGDLDEHYWDNPEENWAEVYARVAGFEYLPWTYNAHLAPDAGALDAVRRDVLTPWTHNKTARFTMAAGRRSQTFRVPVTLDGTIEISARAARNAKVAVNVVAGDETLGSSPSGYGASTVTVRPACRNTPTEIYSVTVRRSGSTARPVQLTVSYPG